MYIVDLNMWIAKKTGSITYTKVGVICGLVVIGAIHWAMP